MSETKEQNQSTPEGRIAMTDRIAEIRAYDDTQCHDPGPKCAEYIRYLLGEVERLNLLNEDKFKTIQAYCKAASEDKAEVERLKARIAELEASK